MKEKVVVVSTTGNVSIIELKIDEDGLVLKDLQRLVGGYIEIVPPRGLPSPYVLVCDEEGLLKQKPVNVIGTTLYGDPIVGDIVIMKDGFRDGEPDIVGMDDDHATRIARQIVSLHPWAKIIVHE